MTRTATTRDPDRSGGSLVGTRGKQPIFDLSGIDLNATVLTRADLEKWNPHRGAMALLDSIVWKTEDWSLGLGVKEVRHDEFWVPGHFPGRPMMPGVLQIECGAQLACYMYNARFPEPRLAAFTRIEEAVFRSAVVPGDKLYLLCQELRFHRRQFQSNIQGVVNGDRIAFDAIIRGVSVD